MRLRLWEMLCGVRASLQWNLTACVGGNAEVAMEEAVLRFLCGDWEMEMWLVLWERRDKSSSWVSLLVRWDSGLVKIVVGGCGWNGGGWRGCWECWRAVRCRTDCWACSCASWWAAC